jgi:hypothetical protein
MPFFTTATIAGLAAAGGAVASSAIGAHAAGKAAGAQVDAANYAANLKHQDAQDALAFEKQQYNTNQANLAPWLNTGKDALSQLWSMYKGGQFGNFNGTFTPPTAADVQNDPGYQFGLTQGEGALQNSAAARGKLFSGNTAEALTKFGTDYAGTKYNDAYQRALSTFNTNYGVFENNQTNNFNRLAALSGIGQQAGTTLGTQGNQTASNISNTLLTSGQQIGNDVNNAAAARASGYVGGANAWNGAFGGINNLALLAALNNGGGSTDPYGAPTNYGISTGQYPT